MRQVIVGMGTCGLSAGARETYETLQGLLEDKSRGLGDARLSITGCIGMCYREPLVEVRKNGRRTIYGDVKPARAREIVDSHLAGGRPLADGIVYSEDASTGLVGGAEKEFLALQKRIVLRHCGLINPESIEDYEAEGGYRALRKALFEMAPAAIIEEVKQSGATELERGYIGQRGQDEQNRRARKAAVQTPGKSLTTSGFSIGTGGKMVM